MTSGRATAIPVLPNPVVPGSVTRSLMTAIQATSPRHRVPTDRTLPTELTTLPTELATLPTELATLPTEPTQARTAIPRWTRTQPTRHSTPSRQADD